MHKPGSVYQALSPIFRAPGMRLIHSLTQFDSQTGSRLALLCMVSTKAQTWPHLNFSTK